MATANEITQMIDYLNAAFMLSDERRPTEATIAVYVELLADLPVEALRTAARLVVVGHKYATFPSIAELREAAVTARSGQVTELGPGEAWSLAWRAIGRIDPDVQHTYERATKDLPPIVLKAMLTIGVRQLVHAANLDVARAHFMRAYESILARKRHRALLPAKVTQSIESGAAAGPASLPPNVDAVAKQIGVER